MLHLKFEATFKISTSSNFFVVPALNDSMRSLLEKLPYSILAIFAVILGLAPFTGQPHLLEKLSLLVRGELTKLIDIFDLFYHSSPLLLLTLKAYLGFNDRMKR